MQDQHKKAAAVHGTRLSDGAKLLRGHNAVDPSGHVVLLPGDTALPGDDWRWATEGDLEAAELAKLEADDQDKADTARSSGGPLK
jgi:hypothetical protein